MMDGQCPAISMSGHVVVVVRASSLSTTACYPTIYPQHTIDFLAAPDSY